MIGIGMVLVALIVLHLIYAFVVVPFHYWSAAKMGVKYDPRRNEYYTPAALPTKAESSKPGA